MKDNIATLIKHCRIFSALDIEVLEGIEFLFTPIELDQDDILFKQGDPSTHFYVLISGTLIAGVVTASGGKFIGSIESGESVGELGALSGEDRTLTVKAAQKSRLLMLSSEEFIKLCNQYPTIILETIKPIINRSQRNIKIISSEKECNYVGIIIQNKKVPIQKIKEKFIKNLPIDREYAFICDSDLNEDKIVKLLEGYEKKYTSIIAILDSEETALSKIILEKSSTVYLISDTELDKELDPFANEIINSNHYRSRIKFEHILLHKTPKPFPKNTLTWIDKEKFFQHHHLRIESNSDYQRLLRFFSGNAIGLVLGGGGARGWLHIGVLKALHESKIPIDAIGGTSIGALVGACYLSSLGNFDDLLTKFKYINLKSGPPFSIKDFTFPMISFLNSGRITECIKVTCENLLIEDLWQSFFCVSSNASTFKEHLHRSGLLFERIRASIAIPGILPPMVIDSHLHYDGALCNNLPVDIMRNIVGAKGKIIAVALTNYGSKCGDYDFPPVLRFKDVLMRKFKLKKPAYRFPPFFDTFYNVLTFSSCTRTRENEAFSDIFINPDINNYSMLNLKKHQETELLQYGYRELIEALGNWKFDESKGELLKIKMNSSSQK